VIVSRDGHDDDHADECCEDNTTTTTTTMMMMMMMMMMTMTMMMMTTKTFTTELRAPRATNLVGILLGTIVGTFVGRSVNPVLPCTNHVRMGSPALCWSVYKERKSHA
jgi:preprotein translocase subunit SecF